MEKKVRNDNMKKVNINITANSFAMQLKNLYDEKIKKIHLTVGIIVAIIYTISFIFAMYSCKTGNANNAIGVTTDAFLKQVQDNFLLDGILIIAGITPYFYLSFIGGMQAVVIVNDMMARYVNHASFMFTLYIGGLIQMIGVSLCIAVGMYYCRLTTKKNKYYKQAGFTFDDVKMQLYQMRKNDKKIEEITKKKEEKVKKIQDCNVKIPLMQFAVLGVIAFIIEFIGLVITKI